MAEAVPLIQVIAVFGLSMKMLELCIAFFCALQGSGLWQPVLWFTLEGLNALSPLL